MLDRSYLHKFNISLPCWTSGMPNILGPAWQTPGHTFQGGHLTGLACTGTASKVHASSLWSSYYNIMLVLWIKSQATVATSSQETPLLFNNL